jgi:hypothetical protein
MQDDLAIVHECYVACKGTVNPASMHRDAEDSNNGAGHIPEQVAHKAQGQGARPLGLLQTLDAGPSAAEAFIIRCAIVRTMRRIAQRKHIDQH